MPRARRPLRLLCALAFLVPLALCGSEPGPAAPTAANQQRRAPELVSQLGSEDFGEREAATEQLLRMGLAARAAVQAAASSEDAEVRSRVRRILPLLQAIQDEQAFLTAMETAWPTALRQGRLAGPLLGAILPAEGPTPSAGNPQLAAGPATDEQGAARRGETLRVTMDYLSGQQSEDGAWRAQAHGASAQADVEQTSLALLAFIGFGTNEKAGPHTQAVRRGVAWLRSRQRADGALLNEGWREVDGITHALAGWVLAEAAGTARRGETILAAQAAVQYSVAHQTRIGGRLSGFGRCARWPAPDLLTTTLFVMQLKSAKVAGLDVPRQAFEGVLVFLDTVQQAVGRKTDGPGTRCAYRLVPDGKCSPQATILGLLCRYSFGWKREELEDTAVSAFGEWNGLHVGRPTSDVLLNFLGMLVAYHQHDDLYRTARETFWPQIELTQRREEAEKGSWDADGVWSSAGRLFSTACNALCLQLCGCWPMCQERKR